MVFASFIFLFWFLPAFLPIYCVTPARWRNLCLTCASFVFYGWWRPHYVLLMVGSVLVDYTAARCIGEPGSGGRRKTWLWISMVANLSLLGWFKYANFFASTWNALTPWPWALEHVVLPVGISFFTFQSMSYTIDVYRGDVKPVRSLLDLLCFVSMFPQLVAGPIVRYSDVQEDLVHRTVDLKKVTDGLFLFALGLIKKVLIADSVLPIADATWDLDAPGLVASWVGGIAFSIHCYFDFSGYSDMAIGLGLMLGFHFPSNFLSPFRSHNVTELWRRWHVSLSTWLRDYLYIPLGGNRKGPMRAQVNLMLVMLIGGLWHGAGWNFVLWGAWHGVWLVIERRSGKQSPFAWLPLAVQVVITFLIFTVGVVIFRCERAGELQQMMWGLSGLYGIGSMAVVGQPAPFAYGALFVGLFVSFAMPRSEQLVQRFHPLVMGGTMLLFVLAICQMLTNDFVSFVYFQF
ncbi:MAG: MBOAT family O-acyltransferase [Planctomycetota bacterium]